MSGLWARSAVFGWTFELKCAILKGRMVHPSFRGVAQLIARSVWDREVEGLSPFTPTK